MSSEGILEFGDAVTYFGNIYLDLEFFFFFIIFFVIEVMKNDRRLWERETCKKDHQPQSRQGHSGMDCLRYKVHGAQPSVHRRLHYY